MPKFIKARFGGGDILVNVDDISFVVFRADGKVELILKHRDHFATVFDAFRIFVSDVDTIDLLKQWVIV